MSLIVGLMIWDGVQPFNWKIESASMLVAILYGKRTCSILTVLQVNTVSMFFFRKT